MTLSISAAGKEFVNLGSRKRKLRKLFLDLSASQDPEEENPLHLQSSGHFRSWLGH